jgi:virginiamycin B lyase
MMSKTNQALIGVVAVLLASSYSGTPVQSAGAEAPSESIQSTESYGGTVQGVVTDSAGRPVAGAFVKLRNPRRRLTIMVVSRDEGRYTAQKLLPGSWVVQGVGGEFQSAWSAPVDVPVQGSARADLSLTDRRAPMLAAAWPRRIPEEQATMASLPEGRGKEIIQARCVSCHEGTRIAANRVDRASWRTTVEEMRAEMKNANLPDLTDQDAAALIDYLATNLQALPAPDPNSRLPRTLMAGEARKYRVVQYELENEGAETHDVAVDPFGVGWANQRLGGKISHFDPVTLEYGEISPPMTTAPKARPGNLQISAEGIMWLPDPNEKRWLSYDIKAGQWTTWPFPSTVRGQANGNSMALHPDGTIWSTGPGSARRLNPVTKEWSSWDTPTWLRTKQNPGGYGITIAGDGRAWFAMNLVDRMARVDGKTGEVAEFAIPVEGISYPRRMDADANGDVWVGLWGAGKLLKIDHKTSEMTVIDPLTPKNGAYAISIDTKKNLIWVTLHKVDKIARFNPVTNEWVEFPLPQAETDVRRIEFDPNNPNRVWWSSVANFARIGFIELLGE